jgi:hypothetical protein
MTPGGEIRFVTEAPHFRMFLSTLEGDAEVLVFLGEQLVMVDHLEPGRITCLHVNAPATLFETARSPSNRFAPGVWRVMLAGYQPVFHELETFGWSVRPPTGEEGPSQTWLAYGSSITSGVASPRVDMSFTQVTARRLGVDVLNMGFGGACHCEPELADYFAGLEEWSFATLELGVNMRESFEPAEFVERAGYFIDRLLAGNLKRPVVLITPFVTGGDREEPPPLEA